MSSRNKLQSVCLHGKPWDLYHRAVQTKQTHSLNRLKCVFCRILVSFININIWAVFFFMSHKVCLVWLVFLFGFVATRPVCFFQIYPLSDRHTSDIERYYTKFIENLFWQHSLSGTERVVSSCFSQWERWPRGLVVVECYRGFVRIKTGTMQQTSYEFKIQIMPNG